MNKRVLDVGQCDMDHASMRSLIEENFDAQLVRVHFADQALDMLRRSTFDLVLINRLLDRDQTEGMLLLRQIKENPGLASVPVMLVTNYLEHQDLAVAAGASRGFGKSALGTLETRQTLAPYLS